MMKLVEIKELSKDEIVDQVKKSRSELVELHMKFASRQLEDPSLISKKRKEIARLLTIQTQKLNDKSTTVETSLPKLKKTDKPKRKEKESAKKAK